MPAGGQDGFSFNNLTPFLNKAGYKTVVINGCKIGEKKGPIMGRTLHDLANQIAELIKIISDTPIHVLGWAFGNRVARCLAEDHPKLVKAVILLAAGGRVPPTPETSMYFGVLRKKNSSRDKKLEALKFLFFSNSTDIETVEFAFKDRKPWAETTQTTPLMEWWNGGQVPILVIQGFDDKTAVPENGIILKKDNEERVTLVNIENSGHFMVYEQPEQVAEAIISFLSSFQ
ncbi:MAG: alpha/beta fold hydrolase [Promethearchaeota archaeon]